MDITPPIALVAFNLLLRNFELVISICADSKYIAPPLAMDFASIKLFCTVTLFNSMLLLKSQILPPIAFSVALALLFNIRTLYIDAVELTIFNVPPVTFLAVAVFLLNVVFIMINDTL